MSTAMDTTSKHISSEEFRLDMSSGEKSEPTKFDHVTDNTLTVLVNHGNTLNELYHLKDELLQYSLPPSFLLQVVLLTSRTYRSFSDLNILVKELIRLVKQYSVPWEEKGEVLKKLRADYDSKHRQLTIAVKHLEMLAAEEERMKHERRLNHWMRLYTKTMASKSAGRRWKFRIQPFKKKMAEGYNPYGSESESEEDEEITKYRLTPSDVEDDELRDLASDRASELSQALSSRLSAAVLKRVQFAGLEETDQPSSSPTDVPPVETCDASTWTKEPDYDYHLIVIIYRPQGLLLRKDICCTLTLGDSIFTSDIYKPKDTEGYQIFRFALTDDEAGYLPILIKDPEEATDLYFTPKISIAVFSDNIANNMAAHCSVLLPKVALNGNPKVVVPPISNTEPTEDQLESGSEDKLEGKQDQQANVQETTTDAKEPQEQSSVSKIWEPDWEGLISQVMVEDPDPVVYPLKIIQDAALPSESDDEDEAPPPCVPLICQVIKIQRHQQFETASCTQPLESLLNNMGYKKLTEVESRAISALMLDPSRANSPDKVPETSNTDEEEKMSTEEVAQLTLKHAEELNQLQQQYESKLQTLSRTLARVKSEKKKEIEVLEEALVQSESKNRHRMYTGSPSELRKMLAQKKKQAKVTKGLPEWGKTIPDNFYERLELFAHESMRKHAEMTEKIKREVQQVCEKQLATLHKLAPNIATNPDSAMDDVCLPALFMPTPTSRPIIYNPRAHSYFHPPGSEDNRVSQPPAIFKLPPVQQGYLSTMNLYELGQDFSKTGPAWLRSDQSPHYTPAPPPSACDYYLPPSNDTKYYQKPTGNRDNNQ